MFCTKCGNKMAEGTVFCGNCGNKMNSKESQGFEPQQEAPQQQQQQQQTQQQSATIIVENKEKKAKAKVKWPVLVGVVVLVLVGGFVLKDKIIYAMSPELHIKLAAKNTLSKLEKDYSKMQSLVLGGKNTSNGVEIEAVINQISHSDPWMDNDIYMLSGMGMGMSTMYDDQKKELYFNGKYIIQGEDIASIDIKLDDKELLFNIPELFTEVISIPSKDFGKSWNKSIFYQETGISLEETLDLSISNLEKLVKPNKIEKGTQKAYIDALKKMIQNAEYTKNGTESLGIDGKSKQCNKTVMTLKERDIKESIISILDIVKKETSIKDLINTIEDLQGYNNYYGGMDFQHEFEEAIEDMKSEVREYFELDRVVMTLYTYDGNIVKSTTDITPDRDYMNETLVLDIELLGGKSMLDDFRLEMKVDRDGFVYKSKGNHSGDKNLFYNNTILEAFSYGETVRFESSVEIDLSKKKDNFEVYANMTADGGYMDFIMDGDFNQSTNSTELKSDNVRFIFQDYYGDTFDLGLGLNYKVGRDVGQKWDFSGYGKLKPFEMSQYDIEDFVYSIEHSAYQLVEKIQYYIGY